MNEEKEITMQELVNYCKQYGFIFQGSEIYDGLANTWDFGPIGALLKDNVKKAWIKKFIQEDTNNVGLDSAILMNPRTWEASGHLKTFTDPLIDCKECKTRHGRSLYMIVLPEIDSEEAKNYLVFIFDGNHRTSALFESNNRTDNYYEATGVFYVDMALEAAGDEFGRLNRSAVVSTLQH